MPPKKIPTANKSAQKDQYHHVIPRFILREFQIGPRKTKRERVQDYRKFGFVDEKVWFYDMNNQSLEPRLISGVYGVTNLYQDTKAKQVDELEKKLAVLENASSIILQDLHDAVFDKQRNAHGNGNTIFEISREKLEQLRKFLFLMHYRQNALALSYFSPYHPDNAPIRERILRMRKKLKLESSTDMWLHFMRYYLDTPHSQIGLDAVKGMPESMDPMNYFASSMLNPDSENFEAITYQSHAGMYYLGIVEAAPGEEFVLGHNSFGLWEGLMPGHSPGIHRLFIVSPRIALILRLNYFRPDMSGAFEDLLPLCKSDLLGIPIPGAKPSRGIPHDRVQDIMEYKNSSAGKKDTFSFTITKLTGPQTYLINSVVLLNIRPEGSITFLTPKIMRSTIRTHWRNKEREVFIERSRYEPLIRRLSSSSPVISGESIIPLAKPILLPAPAVRLHHGDGDLPITSPPRRDGDRSPRTMEDPFQELHRILTAAIDNLLVSSLASFSGPPIPPEDYYKNTRILWMSCENVAPILRSPHPFILDYKQTSKEMVKRYTSILRPDLPLLPPRPHVELIEVLSTRDAAFFHQMTDMVTDKLGFGYFSEDEIRELSGQFGQEIAIKLGKKWKAVVKDVAILGFVSWMAKYRYDSLDLMLPNINIVRSTEEASSPPNAGLDGK